MKRFGMSSLVALAATALLGVSACDEGGGAVPTPTPDTTVGAETTADAAGGTDTAPAETQEDVVQLEETTTDEGGQETGGPDTPIVTPGCDKSDFTAAASELTEPQTGVTVITMTSSTGTPTDLLRVEIYGGSFGGASAPGTYSLEGTNYEDCGNCVLIRTNCGAESCDKVFYADAGSLVITDWEVGGSFKGRLDGVSAKEVTIDTTTYKSTPVAGGETWCLDGYTFEAAVPDGPPTFEGTVQECVAEGNGNLVGANVSDVSYTNCLGEAVSLHAGGCSDNGVKALWVMATAGWCTACEQTLAQVTADHGGSLSREAIGQKTPGLDMLIVLGENQNGAAPTEAYCMAYAEKNKLDPAMVVIDNNTEGIQMPLITPAGYAVEINGLAATWSAINPYLTANEQGQVQTAYPWHAVVRTSNMEYVWSDYFSGLGLNGALNAVLSAP